ncbi:hypothetical protein HY409_01505 [Candidatus Gottesmanbacteria bacterium]|nr:hypothetical protein [Candidatus Gottesmanbacteria bacterium]
MDEDENISIEDYKKILPVAVIIVIVLTSISVLAYISAKNRTPTIVLPGGITYLGPSEAAPTQNSKLKTQNEIQPIQSGKIPIPPDAKWSTQTGRKYPYSFLYPSTLPLGVFPNDPYDAVGIFWNNQDASANLLLRMEDLNQIKEGKEFVAKSKKEYANIWWKQYGYKSVASIEKFTNRNGLTGYRAKYMSDKGQTPYDNVFFEVPNRPELVIWMASGLLSQSVFDRIVDSLSWKTNDQ